jgi:hypothetical protein
VLLNSSGGTDRSLPAIEQFDHVIAAVQHRGQPDFTYLDLTTFDIPDGEIAPSYQGGFGLVVLPDGSTKDITFPKDSAGSTDQRFVGELTADGKVSGTMTFTFRGESEIGMRASFAEPLDSARWANLKRGAPKPFPGATVDTVILFDPANHKVPANIQFVLKGGDGAKPAGPLSILSIPQSFRGGGAAFRNLVEDLQRADTRRLPIDASKVLGTGTTREELVLTLPQGWTAQLPESVNAVSEFGSYRVEYSQVGRELHVVHTSTAGTGVYPPSHIATLIDWFRQMAKDDAEFIPLTRSS